MTKAERTLEVDAALAVLLEIAENKDGDDDVRIRAACAFLGYTEALPRDADV